MFEFLSNSAHKGASIELDEVHLPETDDVMEHTGYGHHRRSYRCIPITFESLLRYEPIRETVLAHLSNADRTSIRACARNLQFIGLVSPLVDLMTRYIPVQNSLLANLDIIDIIALSRTTKAFARLYQSSLKMQFNINRNLEQYFTSPKAFRNMQAKCDAIIASTFVEDFFTRTNPVHDEGHMEIIVGKGVPTADMLSFLLADGWTRIMSSDDDESLDIQEGVIGLSVSFWKISKNSIGKEQYDPTYQILELKVSTWVTEPLHVVLSRMTYTHDLAFITWSHAYALLPYTSLVLRHTYLLENGLEFEPVDLRDTQRELCRYDKPHYKPHYLPSRVDVEFTGRHVGDRHTWFIPLDVEGIEPSKKPLHLTTHAMFQIKPCSHPDEATITSTVNVAQRTPVIPAHYKVDATILQTQCLKHRYITFKCDDNENIDHICEERYKNISYLQIESMEIGDRPPGYAAFQEVDLDKRWTNMPSYRVPEYWRYYDDEVEAVLRSRFDGPRMPDTRWSNETGRCYCCPRHY